MSRKVVEVCKKIHMAIVKRKNIFQALKISKMVKIGHILRSEQVKVEWYFIFKCKKYLKIFPD